jgi:hypothetical protein
MRALSNSRLTLVLGGSYDAVQTAPMSTSSKDVKTTWFDGGFLAPRLGSNARARAFVSPRQLDRQCSDVWHCPDSRSGSGSPLRASRAGAGPSTQPRKLTRSSWHLPRAGAAGYLIDPWISRRRFPPDARNLPLVMWHEAGQFSKTWEMTPDGEWATRRSFWVVALPSTKSISRGEAGRAGARWAPPLHSTHQCPPASGHSQWHQIARSPSPAQLQARPNRSHPVRIARACGR